VWIGRKANTARPIVFSPVKGGKKTRFFTEEATHFGIVVPIVAAYSCFESLFFFFFFFFFFFVDFLYFAMGIYTIPSDPSDTDKSTYPAIGFLKYFRRLRPSPSGHNFF